MSIKGAHLLFIICSVILAVLFGVWSFLQADKNPSFYVGGIVAFILGVILINYAIKFVKKMKSWQ